MDLTFLSEVLSVAWPVLTAALSAGSCRWPHHVCKIDTGVLFNRIPVRPSLNSHIFLATSVASSDLFSAHVGDRLCHDRHNNERVLLLVLLVISQRFSNKSILLHASSSFAAFALKVPSFERVRRELWQLPSVICSLDLFSVRWTISRSAHIWVINTVSSYMA
jgi:hypothetical protein